MGCMGAMLFNKYIVDDVCPYRRIFEYVQQNKDQLEPVFDEWEKRTGGLND